MNKTTQATVKIMLSHDYCHFEISKTIEAEKVLIHGEDGHLTSAQHLTQEDIDNARKDVQRLADKAVGQYKKAKNEASKSAVIESERLQLRREVSQIKIKPEEEWSIYDKAKVKALQDYDHNAMYNYDDDSSWYLNNEIR
jgi:hypothetical protein